MRTMAAASVGEHDRALNSMNVSMFATMFAQSSRVHIARDMPGWITLARMRKLRVGGGGPGGGSERWGGGGGARGADEVREEPAGGPCARAGSRAEAGSRGERRGEAPDESDRYVGEPGEYLLRWVVAGVGDDAGREKHVHRQVHPRVVPQLRAAVLRGGRAGVAHYTPRRCRRLGTGCRQLCYKLTVQLTRSFWSPIAHL